MQHETNADAGGRETGNEPDWLVEFRSRYEQGVGRASFHEQRSGFGRRGAPFFFCASRWLAPLAFWSHATPVICTFG